MELVKSSGRPRGRSIALLVAGLLTGTVLIQPAVAHVTRRLGHLQKHLDKRYVKKGDIVANAANAANADRLDGKDSTAFVGSEELLWAVVESSGTLVRGQGAVGVTTPFSGQVRVKFNRAVNTCAWVATPGENDAEILFDPTFISTGISATDQTVIVVETKNPGGGLTPEPFHLAVTC
jgi:hypothetical protein